MSLRGRGHEGCGLKGGVAMDNSTPKLGGAKKNLAAQKGVWSQRGGASNKPSPKVGGAK